MPDSNSTATTGDYPPLGQHYYQPWPGYDFVNCPACGRPHDFTTTTTWTTDPEVTKEDLETLQKKIEKLEAVVKALLGLGD